MAKRRKRIHHTQAFWNKQHARRAANLAKKQEAANRKADYAATVAALHHKPQTPTATFPNTTLGKIQENLYFLANNESINVNDTLGARIMQAIGLINKNPFHDPQPGETNQHYSISPEWDGRESTIFNYFEIKYIPPTTQGKQAEDYLLMNVNDPRYGSQEKYDKFIEEASHQAYITNLMRRGLKYNDINNFIMKVEGIMNSSPMWKLIDKSHPEYDSNQQNDLWKNMYQSVTELAKTRNMDAMERIIIMVMNQDNYDRIVNEIDALLTQILKES